ncbi:branched-chain amino acid ABC transporter permease/ATP-binding protein [Pseudofrankia sp. DC12]|uniref:branched-chain amino acid ABC transporter permease/ATP-binding protein n=1 Tax=Pseudofrankia sp. DC12 TaxID=683315 RepID=UPI000695F0A9|nr:branched-chain amino acid ABC transporter permease/ATP-binding protein [Pseudofrankia sp. DC12]
MDVLRFALLGLASGAVFALVAQALVLTYRASGILNLAQGAFTMVGAYSYYQLADWGAPLAAAVVGAVLLSGLLGIGVFTAVIRPLRRSSGLTRVVATLGVLMVLQSVVILCYGIDVRPAPSWLPTRTIEIVKGTPVGLDRYAIVLIGCAATAGLWAVYRHTRFGRVTSAVAENPQAAASLGHSPGRVAALNWGLGSALAGIAGTMIGPIIYLEPTQLVLLVLPALAAAMIGGFASFPLAFAAALGIGVAQGWLQRYVDNPGWSTAVPFLAVIGWLVLRGRGLPLRSHLLDRLPAAGSGRLRPGALAVLLGGLCVLVLFGLSAQWSAAFSSTVLTAVVCLSVVVVTGFAGQLSLAQYVLAGVGALVAAKLSATVPFALAVPLAVLATAAIGAVIGLPSLRTRGVTLAVVTLGLADVLYQLVLDNNDVNGGTAGLPVAAPTLFGWNIDPLAHPERYALVALGALVVVAVAVSNLRRGAVGRRLLAVRSNERAAAALGIGVYGAKLYAFTVAAAIAALGGVLLAYQQFVVLTPQFAVFTSLVVVGVTVAGGVGMIGGALVGSLLMPGGVTSQLLHGVPDINVYLPLAGGLFLLAGLRMAPDGLVELNRRTLARLRRRAGAAGVPAAAEPAERRDRAQRRRFEGRALRIDGLCVGFGGVHALTDVSLRVGPGQVHGLIGPNGAGKTTLIDAVTGFVSPSAGSVWLGDTAVDGWSARRRARGGLVRSFQSLELFSDLTVRENLAVSCDDGRRLRYLTDLVYPGRVRLSADALDAVEQCGLAADLGLAPEALPFGRRRLVAIARAIAAGPSVLLLDEPAAGLDTNEAAELGRLIRSVADRGVAVLLVEHRVDLIASCCDVVTVLRSGQVLSTGEPGDVLTRPEVLDAYLGTRPSPKPAEVEREEAGTSAVSGTGQAVGGPERADLLG